MNEHPPRVEPAEQPPQPAKWEAIDAFRNGLAPAREQSAELIRRIRDEAY